LLSKNIDFPIELLYNLFMIKVKIGCCKNSGMINKLDVATNEYK